MVTATRSLLGRERGQRDCLQDQQKATYNSLPRVSLKSMFYVM